MPVASSHEQSHEFTYLVLAHLLKIPRPGDSKMTFSVFELSCRLLLLV